MTKPPWRKPPSSPRFARSATIVHRRKIQVAWDSVVEEMLGHDGAVLEPVL